MDPEQLQCSTRRDLNKSLLLDMLSYGEGQNVTPRSCGPNLGELEKI